MNLANRAHPIDLQVLLETRLLVQAGSGGGKSWALRRILEQTASHVQQLVIDPEGEFASLRERFDYVIAAAHDADAVVSPQTAALLARRLMESGVSAILDIYDLKHHERVLFVRRFLDALVNLPRKLWHPTLVVLDEAHVFCPQVGSAESASAVIDIATRGRKRGLCPVLATQRLSKLHKDAAAEMQNKLIGLTGLDVDVKRAADELGMSPRDAMHVLRALNPGQFYAFGPALTRTPELVKIGAVVTTHPKAGQRLLQAPPPASAKVRAELAKLADLQKDADQEARTVEELKAENAKLRREVAIANKRAPVETTANTDKTQPILNAWKRWHAHSDELICQAQKNIALMQENLKKSSDAIASFNPIPRGAVDPGARATDAPGKAMQSPTPRSFAGLEKREEVIAKPGTLSKGERAVLIACAQHQPNGCTREQLSILTGYKRSTRDAYIQRLREKGQVDTDGAQILATDAGVATLGSDFEPLPTGSALREHWLERLSRGEAAILRILCDSYPGQVPRDELSQLTGLARSSRDAYLQRLQARQLVKTDRGGAVAASTLFDQ